jgi:hypothetical protein
MKTGNLAPADAHLLRPALTILAVVLLGASCAPGRWTPVSLPGPDRPAERSGPSRTTIAIYDPALFGPDVPLARLVEERRLPLEAGKLKRATLLVNKAQRRLELWVGRKMIKAYRIQLGWNPHGPKLRQGDRRTPEGRYVICDHRPSKYYLALWLAYPNLADARRGLASGLIGPEEYRAIARGLAGRACPPQTTRLGGDIVIHGEFPERSLPPGSRGGDVNPAAVREFEDWTDGCVALFNRDLRELYNLVSDGAEVLIVANARVTAPTALSADRTAAPRR